MTVDQARPIGQIVEIDPQELKFHAQVLAWVAGTITYEKLLRSVPTYDLDPISRIERFLENSLRKKTA